MRPDHYEELDQLLARAFEVETSSRQAFLEQQCAGRPEIRSQLQRLLAADASASSFLDTPPPRSWGEVSKFLPGERLGSYRIENEIARGGMGTVYLAHRDDGQYQRQVAIKRLHRLELGEEGAARFRDERRILAGLEHPHISRLYDSAELPAGDAFLVMEYVEGEPISTYCGQRRMSIPDRLRLFLKVLDAVAYAHQNLLVHRDLKPENILVNADGEPKLIDFGIAKQLASDDTVTSSKVTAACFLTPLYASPEQLRGERVSTTSDIYSLGVVLYELLAGQSPYRLGQRLPHQVCAAVLEQVPARASEAVRGMEPERRERVAAERGATPAQLVRGLVGDLDTVLATALVKEPGKRYSSVAEFAADLERHLQGFPIRARGGGAAYRFGKFVARHRSAMIAAGLAVFLLTSLLLHSLLAWQRAERERARAEESLSFLAETFRGIDPRQNGGVELTVAELLETAAGRLGREDSIGPEARAMLSDTLGDAYFGLGHFESAAALLEQSLAVRRSRADTDPGQLGDSLLRLAMARLRQGELEASTKLLREAVCAKRRLFGVRRAELAEPLNLLGLLLARQISPGNGTSLTEVAALHEEALELAQHSGGTDNPQVLIALLYLADLHVQSGNVQAAEQRFRDALSARLRVGDESSRLVSGYRIALAKTLLARDRLGEAEEQLRLAASEGVLPDSHPGRRAALRELARLEIRQGRYAEAEVRMRRVLASERALFGERTLDLATWKYLLGMALLGQEKLDEALTVHREALALRQRLLGEFGLPVAQSLGGLALALSALSRHEEAEAMARENLKLQQKLFIPHHAEMAWPLRNLGDVLLASGRAAAAESFLRQSLELMRETRPAKDLEAARVKVLLGKSLLAQGRGEEARELLASGTEILAASYGGRDRLVVEGRRLLAEAASQRRESFAGSMPRASGKQRGGLDKVERGRVGAPGPAVDALKSGRYQASFEPS